VLEAEDILAGLMRGAVSGRRKSWGRTHRAMRGGGLINPTTILAAAGVAWGLYETWQAQQARTAAARPPGMGGTGPAGLPVGGTAPPPLPSEPGLPEPVLRLLRVMISAARADGEIGPQEREKILAEAREVGAEAVVSKELDAPRPLGEIVAGVTDPQFKEQLYSLAFTIVRADETLTGGERIYMAQLANRLGLDAATVARLEGAVSAHIDAAGAPGSSHEE
jgi:uncharacterized membrane protein YebE (DUF533 family)